tara:strand:+ start:247 stop:366 length:120 start_codon:yes stop_codon:yes gene_type:complete
VVVEVEIKSLPQYLVLQEAQVEVEVEIVVQVLEMEIHLL